MDLPFSEWTREAKDEFAKKRMDEMRSKNELLKQRHAEVEQDRMKAEAINSSVTSSKVTKKENIVFEKVEDIPKSASEREWDRGKIDQDADDWSPPKFHGYRSRAPRRSFPDRRTPKKEENWRVRPTNSSKDRQSYFSKFRPSSNHKYQESNNQGTSSSRNETNFSRQRGRGHRMTSGTYRSFQNSRRLDEPRKKSISGGVGSASPSPSDSEAEPIKHQVKSENDRVWRDGGINEVQQKQSRVEKWVKSVNTATSWNDDDNFNEKKYEPGKKYGFSNDDGYTKKMHTSREQNHLKNRERYDDVKYNQFSRGSLRGRGNRTPADDRAGGIYDNKNQRDIRKKNFGDKSRSRRESDLSDRTSSMKESDYHDGKDKFNKTTSDSKSSDYSGKWEDEECEFKYAAEKKFEIQSNTHSYDKDKFNKSKSLQSSSFPANQDGTRKDDFNNDSTKCMHQKFHNNYVKDRSKVKNFRNSDYSGYDDQYSSSRKSDNYSFGKNKFNRLKSESKYAGFSERYEDDAIDNHARSSHKYKFNKSSPKRVQNIPTQSFQPEYDDDDDDTWGNYESPAVFSNSAQNNPVKSVDTSSSASKTVGYHSPEPDDEDIWGGYEDQGIRWNIENPVEHQDTSVKEISHTKNFNAPAKHVKEENPQNEFYGKNSDNIGCIRPEDSDKSYEVNKEFISETKNEKHDNVLDEMKNVDNSTCQNEVNQMMKLGESKGNLNPDLTDIAVDKCEEVDHQNEVHQVEKNDGGESNLNIDETDMEGGECIDGKEVEADVYENKQILPAIDSAGVKEVVVEDTSNGSNAFPNSDSDFQMQKGQLSVEEAGPTKQDFVSCDADSKCTNNDADILYHDANGSNTFPHSDSDPQIQKIQLPAEEAGPTKQDFISCDADYKSTNSDADVLCHGTDSKLSPSKQADVKSKDKTDSQNVEVSSENIINDKNGSSCNEETTSSSQNVDVVCSKKESEIVPVQSYSTDCKKTAIVENNPGALNLSDDGGWSTVSEEENNESSDQTEKGQ